MPEREMPMPAMPVIRRSDRIMEKFHEWGIEALSPSSLDLFLEDRGRWALRYIEGVKDRPNVKMARGNAIEGILKADRVYDSDDEMTIDCLSVFRLELDRVMADSAFVGNLPDDWDSQVADEVEFIQGAIPAVFDLYREFKVNMRWTGRLLVDLGMEISLIGYPDFISASTMGERPSVEFVYEVKTTGAMPAEYQIEWKEQAERTVGPEEEIWKLWDGAKKAGKMRKCGNYEYLVMPDTGLAWRLGGRKKTEKDLIMSTVPLTELPRYPGITERHKRQVSAYSRALSLPARLLYIGKNRAFIYDVPAEEVERLWRQYLLAARAVRRVIQYAESKADIFEICIPNLDGFRWDEETDAIARKIWNL